MLFEPFTIRGLTLKNRLVVPPMVQFDASVVMPMPLFPLTATVCAALIRLRVTMPAHERPFRVPLWQVVAPLGITASLLLLGSMGWAAIGRIVAWQVAGALVLFISLRTRRRLTPR